MNVVFPEPFAPPADAAVVTVVDLLTAVVVPQLADVAVVACSLGAALHAVLGSLLRGAACHAKHVLRLLALQIVVLDGIVTVAAGIPSPTVIALHLHVPFIVLAAQRRLVVEHVAIVLFDDCVRVESGRARAVCRRGVAGPQVKGVLWIWVGGGRDRRRVADVGEDRVVRRGGERAVLRYEAAGRGGAQVVVALRHDAMHHASLVCVVYAQCADIVDAGAQMAHAVVSRQRLGHLGRWCIVGLGCV